MPGWIRLAAAVLALSGALLFSGSGCAIFSGEADRRAEERSRELVAQGQALLAEGRFDAALAAFALAIEENPQLSEAHLGMGNVFRQRGEYEQAAQAYEQAAALEPESVDALYALGLMKQLTGQADQAADAYLRALTVNPYSFEANRDLASLYLQMNRPAEALPYAQSAVRLNSEDRAAWASLAACLSRLDQWPQAVEAFEQTILLSRPDVGGELGVLISALDPEDIPEPVLMGLANAYIKVGRLNDAASTLRGVIARGGSALAHERLAYVLFRQRRIEEALQQFQAALAFDENDTSALNGVGATKMALYLRDGRRDRQMRREAIAAWRQSLRLQRDQPQIADLIARYIDR